MLQFLRVNKEKYARLFAYSSAKAASMGNTVYYCRIRNLWTRHVMRNRVYINRSMAKEYPMMVHKDVESRRTDGDSDYVMEKS